MLCGQMEIHQLSFSLVFCPYGQGTRDFLIELQSAEGEGATIIVVFPEVKRTNLEKTYKTY